MNLVFFLCVATTGAASAQEVVMRMPGDAYGNVQVIGGVPTSSTVWPATIYFVVGTTACTATVVGRRVLLTAAHCVTEGMQATLETGASTTKVVCNLHPDYRTNFQMDVALCLSDQDVRLVGDARFETLNLDPRRPARGTSVTLLGYGCRSVWGGGPAGELYRGSATVRGFDGAYIVTEGGAALCFGDSGGGAFLQISEERRRLVGVNSRGDISTKSSLTNVTAAGAISFIDTWVKSKGVGICGLNEDQYYCRE